MSNINDSQIRIKHNKILNNETNNIKLFKRTIDNYTHEDISDKKIKQITSYRKSQNKFLSALILNILSFGLLHLISKCYPKIYLKLYCKICSPKNSDFFLVEDIYGKCNLCQTKKSKKTLNKNNLKDSYEESSKAYMCLYSSWNLKNFNITKDNSNSINDQYININNSQIISFYYNSRMYEYDEVNNMIIPIYLNLQGKTNKNIINIFQNGLSSEYLIKKIEERFGKNEYKLNINLIYVYFQKVELKLMIFSILFGSMEIAVRDAISAVILFIILTFYYIFRKIYLWKMLKNFNAKDYTLDGEKINRPKVKRKYMFKLNDHKIKKKKKKKDKKKLIEESLIKDINKIKNLNERNKSENNIIIEEKKEEDYQYVKINNNELLPGDIIYLKMGDFVPCDGIILDGDCVVNEVELKENLKYTYKTYLKYSNDVFIYKNNKRNILLHGTKIIKIYRKNNILDNSKQNKYITVLCLNTGPNTFRANQITNALDLLDKKEQYKNTYKIISGQRSIFLISVSIIFFFTVLVPTIIIVIQIKKYGFYTWFTNKMSTIDLSNSKMGNPTNGQTRGPPSNIQINGGPASNNQTKNEGMASFQSKMPEAVKKQMKKGFLMSYFLNYLLRAIIKSYMPVYFVVYTVIILLTVYRLYKINIFCFEKMRILYAGEINTIFMSKLNVLSDLNYEIKGFYPAFQASKVSNITIQEFQPEQLKDFSSVIFNYYNNIKNNKESFIGLTNISSLNKISSKLSVWFLECLFCCNNLIKIRHDIQGNKLEKNLIEAMKWEIKVPDDEKGVKEVEDFIIENSNKKFGFENSSISDSISDNNDLLYYGSDKEEKYIYNKTMDLFPQNYYKMMDKKNFGYQKFISRFKFFLSNSVFKRSGTTKENEDKLFSHLKKKSIESTTRNNIVRDLADTKCSSYKLRIYKKFLTKNSFHSSAIVYNFYLKTLRFMIKGSPEKILPKCISTSLPEDICQIISNFRKDGYVILICASKKVDIYAYNDSHEENDYMYDLVFCGFITLKNKIKNGSKKTIDELKKMNCEIIMNTGDELYNSIGTGFETNILENKKIFVFDFDENKKQIYVNNIYRPSSYNYEIDEKIKNEKLKRNSYKFIKNGNKKRELSQLKIKKIENINTNRGRQSNIDEEIKNPQNLNQFKYSNINKNRTSKNHNINENSNDNSFISSERKYILNRSSTINEEPDFKADNKEIFNITELQKKSFNKNKKNDINIINSPRKKINKNKIKSFIPLDHKKINKIKNNNNYIDTNDKKNKNENDITDQMNRLYSISNEIENEEIEREYYIKEYFSNICYYTESYFKNLLSDCNFCISGKALNFIHANRETKKFSKLYKIIPKNSKIFYSMTSQDKSFLIDLYRDLPNNKTCMIGYGYSDIDSMLTAHVGICLKRPNNFNTMLSHFYLPSHDLTNVKTIIEHGRVIIENIFLLLMSCIFCTTIIDIYMAFSFYVIMDVQPEHLRMFNAIYYFLSIFGFTNSAGINKKTNFIQNNKLFRKYIIIQFIGNIFIKSFDITLFFYLYRKNSNIEEGKRNTIFINYIAVLSFDQIFTTLFGFNFIRFYRKGFYDNFWFCLILMIFFFGILIALFFSNKEYQNFLTKYYIFENLQENSNSFDERNKLMIFIIILNDLCFTIVFILITQYFFNKQSKNFDTVEKNKISSDNKK